jgi:Ricin-type beta-trefoil lectin domain
VNDTSYAAGQVGFGLVGYQTDQFDNLTVTGSNPTSGQITSGLPGKCLAAGGSANGTPVVIASCNAADAAQQWTVAGATIQHSGACLDVTGKGTANGVLVELWTCNGGTNQQWTVGANSSLVGTGSGKCLDDPGSSLTDGTQQEIWTCNGGANQKWTLPG